MKLYQLKAKGGTIVLDEPGVIYGRRVFRSREHALADIPRFRILCTTEMKGLDLCALKDNDLIVFDIIELEIEDI